MRRKNKPEWRPGLEAFDQVIAEQNPWHTSGSVPAILAREVERPLATALWQRLLADEPRRFHVILGPRRVGKSTAMYQTVRKLIENGVPAGHIWWLRLDHPLLINAPLDQLVRSISRTGTPSDPVYLFLDEITYADNWDLWLKTFYDDRWPVRIVGTSSATAAIRNRRLESGVGRWEEQYLAPYSFGEYLRLGRVAVPDFPPAADLATALETWFAAPVRPSDLSDLRRRFILTGGFPELLLAGGTEKADEQTLLLRSQVTLRSDAVERAVYKDIPQAFDLDSPVKLERLLYTLAGQFTGILSPTGIGQDTGLSQPTFDRYLSYLERAFLVFTLLNYSGSEGSKQRRGRKLYFVDGAVRNAALQRGLGPLTDAAEMGLLFENLVASHLHALGQQSQTRLYYWRDKEDEIDLVYDHPERPLAFEIASRPIHRRSGVRAFMARNNRFRGRCYIVSPTAFPRRPDEGTGGIGSLPLDVLLLLVSSQAGAELARRLAGPLPRPGP